MATHLHMDAHKVTPNESVFADSPSLQLPKRPPITMKQPPMLRRISRFALQQRSRIDAPDPADGTRRLMWAMLKDTLSCYHAHADATTVHGQRMFREAERWLLSRDLSWMFSFENVCTVLEIDCESLRNELRRWRRVRRQHV